MVSSSTENNVRSFAMMFETTMPEVVVSSSSPASKLNKRVEEREYDNNHSRKWKASYENRDLRGELNRRRDESEEREDSLPTSVVTDRVGSIYQVATCYTPFDESSIETSNSHVSNDSIKTSNSHASNENDDDYQSSIVVQCQSTIIVEEEVPKCMMDSQPEEEKRSHHSTCFSTPFDEDAPFDEGPQDCEPRRRVVSTLFSTRTAAASPVEVKVIPSITAAAKKVEEDPKMMESESQEKTELTLFVKEEKKESRISDLPAKQDPEVAVASSSMKEMEIRPSPAPMAVEALDEDCFKTPTPSLEMEEDNAPLLLVQVARRSVTNIRETSSSNVDSNKCIPQMSSASIGTPTSPLFVQAEKKESSISAPQVKQEAEVAVVSSVEETEIRPTPAPMVVEALDEDCFTTPTPSLEMEEDKTLLLLLQVARRSVADIGETSSCNVDSYKPNPRLSSASIVTPSALDATNKSKQQQDETNQPVDDPLYDAFLRRRKISLRRAVPRKLGFATAEILEMPPRRKQVPHVVVEDSPSQPTADRLLRVVPRDILDTQVKTNRLGAEDVEQDEETYIESYWKSKLFGEDDQEELSVVSEESASVGDLNDESYPSLDEMDELTQRNSIDVAGKLTVHSETTNKTEATCIGNSKMPQVCNTNICTNKMDPAFDAELKIVDLHAKGTGGSAYNDSPYPCDAVVTPTVFDYQSFSSLDETVTRHEQLMHKSSIAAAATIANESAADTRKDQISTIGCHIFKQAEDEGSEHRFRFYEPGLSIDESTSMNSVFYEPTAGPEPVEEPITDEKVIDSHLTKGPDVIEKPREVAETIGNNTGEGSKDEKQASSMSISISSFDPERMEETEAFFRMLVESSNATSRSKASSISATNASEFTFSDFMGSNTGISHHMSTIHSQDDEMNCSSRSNTASIEEADQMSHITGGVDPDGSKDDFDSVTHYGCDIFDGVNSYGVEGERGQETAKMEDGKEVGSISEIEGSDVVDAMERVQSLFDSSGSSSSTEVDQTFSQDSSVMTESATMGEVVAVEEEQTNDVVDDYPSEDDDHFELQPTPRHANTSHNLFRPRNCDALSNSLSENVADCWPPTAFDQLRDPASSTDYIDETSSKSRSKRSQEQWEDKELSSDISLDPSDGLKNETVPDYAIAEVVDLIEIFKSEHERNRNICSPNNTPDDGLLARVKTQRSNAPPQNEIAPNCQGDQGDKYYTPTSETQEGEEEDLSTLFGNGVLRKYSSEDDDSVSSVLDKYHSKDDFDKSPPSCSFDQEVTLEIIDKYSSADSPEDKTERQPQSGRSRIEVIAARGRAAVIPPLSPGTLSTSSRPHRSHGHSQSWDGSYLINTKPSDRPSIHARAVSGVPSIVGSSKSSDSCSSTGSSSSIASIASIASMEEQVATGYRAKASDIIAKSTSDANSIIDTLSEGIHILTKPAKDVIMMGDRDIDIICGQGSDESTKPTSSREWYEDEDTDDEDVNNALDVNEAALERHGSAGAIPGFFWGESLFACKCTERV